VKKQVNTPKKQVSTPKKPVSTPLVVVVVLVLIVVLGLLGRVFLRPRMPETPPEFQGRNRQPPAEGMLKGGGMRRSGQPTRQMLPQKAPE